MKALDRKLLRDLRHLKGQVLTIALVLAAGIATFVSMRSAYQSVSESQRAWYERSRFADVFVRLERAPERVLAALETLPGVSETEARLVEDVLLDMPDLVEPVVGRIISLPEAGQPRLNRLYLRQGRMVEPGRSDEVLVSEGFATAHGLEPGDTVSAVLQGQRAELRVVGVALSPEYTFVMAPGALGDDDRRFGIFWMAKEVMAPAFQMEGAFNDVVFRLTPGTRTEAVVDAVDRVLEPYGGLGAHGRDRQMSHRFVENELRQLKVTATVTPLLFLGVAAFLVNVVLSRLVGTQREQIAALKAVGYSNLAVGRHYVRLAMVVVLLGMVLGVVVGAWLGRGLIGLYMEVFRFPVLVFRMEVGLLAAAVGGSAAAAALGALISVWRAVRLPPAEAMRPQAPPTYHPTWLERVGFHRMLSQSGRMVLRDMERRPARLLLSVLGISLAVATPIIGLFFRDSILYLMDVQFGQMQREDVAVTFRGPVSSRALRELELLPGVLHAEPLRSVPVRLEAGPRTEDTQLQGLPAGGEHRRVLDAELRPVPLEGSGLLLGRELARRLGVEVGTAVRVHVLEGERQVLEVPVGGVVDEMVGMSSYMELEALSRLLGQERTLTGATLSVDPLRQAELFTRLSELPMVIGVARTAQAREFFEERSARILLITALVLAGFASVIAVGVVYNDARVALAVRARDLATLRVIGFTRREISTVLLGEMAVSLLLALPVGFVLGRWVAGWVAEASVDNELFSFPAIISPATYAFAALVVLLSGLLSALLVRRRLDHLDLISVLKTRE